MGQAIKIYLRKIFQLFLKESMCIFIEKEKKEKETL